MLTLLRRALTLGAGEGAARILGVVVFAVAARALPLASFGVFSFAVSVGLMLGVLIDAGQNAHVGRVGARDAASGSATMVAAMVNKLWLGLPLAVGAMAADLFLTDNWREGLTVGLMVAWATMLSLLDTMRSYTRSQQRMALDSAVNSGESLLRLLAVVVVWRLGLDMVWMAAAFFCASAVAALWFLSVLHGRRLLAAGDQASALRGRVLSRALPLGLVGITLSGYYRVDQLLVRALAGAEPNALYGASARIAFTATALGMLVTSATYPELAKAAGTRPEFLAVLRRGLVLGCSVAGVAALGLFVFAQPLLGALFGPQYEEAADILKVLSIVVLLNAITSMCVYANAAIHREKTLLYLVVALLALSLALNVTLIPLFGGIAAAWVSAVCECLLAGGAVVVVLRSRTAPCNNHRGGERDHR